MYTIHTRARRLGKQLRLLLLSGFASYLLSGCTLDHQNKTEDFTSGIFPPASRVMIPADGQRVGASSILTLRSIAALSGQPGPDNNSLSIAVRTAVQAYVYCYYQRASGDIIKVYPSSSNKALLLAPGHRLEISVSEAYRQVIPPHNTNEAFLCLAAADDVDKRLPDWVKQTDAEPIERHGFDEIYQIYRRSTQSNLVGRVLTINP